MKRWIQGFRQNASAEVARHRTQRTRLNLLCLEDRITPSWGSIPPATIPVPSGAGSVTLVQNDATGNASITNNEIDYFTFVASVSGSYVLTATTPSSNLDTVLGVFNASGGRIAYNDDISSSNRDSRLSVNLTAGQRYYFGVTNYINTPGGSYTWRVDGPAAAPADDAYENNDTFGTASNLGTLSATRTFTGLQMRDSADWFRFTTTGTGAASANVRIDFTHSSGDLDLELYNSAGTRLGVSQGVFNSEQISLSGLAAGTYYVRVYGYRGAQNNYSMTINPAVNTPPPPGSGGFQITVRNTGLTASQQNAVQQAVAIWERAITGDLPNATYQGITVDDLLVDISAPVIDGAGGILGQAGPDAFRSGTLLPYHGVIEIDAADMANLEQRGQLVSTIAHEIGHILGVGTIWSQRGLLSGAGGANPRFHGANAVREYNAIFRVNDTSVPVEGNTSGPGSRDSHWRESLFGNELLSPYLTGGTQPLSRITLGSLQDLGYVVNYAAADNYVPPGLGGSASRLGGSGSGAALMAGDSVVPAYSSPTVIVPPQGSVAPASRANLTVSVPGGSVTNLLPAIAPQLNRADRANASLDIYGELTGIFVG